MGKKNNVNINNEVNPQEPIEATIIDTEETQAEAGTPAPETEVVEEPKVKWYDRSVKDNAQRFWRKVKTPLAVAGGVLAGAGLVIAKMNLSAKDEFEYDNSEGYMLEDNGTDNYVGDEDNGTEF